MDLIGAAAAEVAGGAAASPLVRNNLQRMADLGNMPRNEKKFKNFLGNSLRVRPSSGTMVVVDERGTTPWSYLTGLNNKKILHRFGAQINRPADQDELWQFLRKRLEAAAASSAAAAAAAAAAATANAAAATTGGAEGTGNGKGKGGGSSNGAESVDNKEDKEEEEQEQQQQQRSQQADRRGQKRKEAAVEAERKTGGGAEVKKQRAKGEAEGGGDFSWHKVIKKAVKGAGEGGVGLKALRKQVVAQALAAGVGLEEGKDGLKKVVKAQIGAVPGVVVRPDKTVVYDKKAK